jgi:hypothetical protein
MNEGFESRVKGVNMERTEVLCNILIETIVFKNYKCDGKF